MEHFSLHQLLQGHCITFLDPLEADWLDHGGTPKGFQVNFLTAGSLYLTQMISNVLLRICATL